MSSVSLGVDNFEHQCCNFVKLDLVIFILASYNNFLPFLRIIYIEIVSGSKQILWEDDHLFCNSLGNSAWSIVWYKSTFLFQSPFLWIKSSGFRFWVRSRYTSMTWITLLVSSVIFSHNLYWFYIFDHFLMVMRSPISI